MKDNERDVSQASLADSPPSGSRRTLFKTAGAAVIAAPVMLTSGKSEAQVVPPPIGPSPATTPWAESLPYAF